MKTYLKGAFFTLLTALSLTFLLPACQTDDQAQGLQQQFEFIDYLQERVYQRVEFPFEEWALYGPFLNQRFQRGGVYYDNNQSPSINCKPLFFGVCEPYYEVQYIPEGPFWNENAYIGPIPVPVVSPTFEKPTINTVDFLLYTLPNGHLAIQYIPGVKGLEANGLTLETGLQLKEETVEALGLEYNFVAPGHYEAFFEKESGMSVAICPPIKRPVVPIRPKMGVYGPLDNCLPGKGFCSLNPAPGGFFDAYFADLLDPIFVVKEGQVIATGPKPIPFKNGPIPHPFDVAFHDGVEHLIIQRYNQEPIESFLLEASLPIDTELIEVLGLGVNQIEAGEYAVYNRPDINGYAILIPASLK